MFIYSYLLCDISVFILSTCGYFAFNIISIRIMVKYMLNGSYIELYLFYLYNIHKLIINTHGICIQYNIVK